MRFVTLSWLYQIWENLLTCLLQLLLYAKMAAKKKEIKKRKLCPVCLYSFRLKFLYKPLYPGSLQVVVSSLSCDMMKKAVLLLG